MGEVVALTAIKRIQVSFNPEQVEAFCDRWDVKELAIFGSVLTPRFRPDSDVDLLVEFLPESHPTLLDMARMERELSQIFGRAVDLVEKTAVLRSRNPIRKQSILSTAEVIHRAH